MVLPAYQSTEFTEAATGRPAGVAPVPEEYVSTSQMGPGTHVIHLEDASLQLFPFVEVPGRRYQLRGAFGVYVAHLDGGRTVHVTYPPLNLAGYGDTYEAAIEAFAEAFDAMYRRLAEQPHAALSARAADLRQRLAALVADVRQQ